MNAPTNTSETVYQAGSYGAELAPLLLEELEKAGFRGLSLCQVSMQNLDPKP